MLFNLQNLFQTEDNEAWVARQEDHPGGVVVVKKGKHKVVDFYKTGVETKLLDPLQQL